MAKRGADEPLENPRLSGPIQPLNADDTHEFSLLDPDELNKRIAVFDGEEALHTASRQTFVQELLKSHRQLKFTLEFIAQNGNAEIETNKKRAAEAEEALANAQASFENDLKAKQNEADASRKRAEDAERASIEARRKSTQSKELRAGHPFALVLIDGDGYIFDERYLRDGLKGGEATASYLREGIERWWRDDENRFKDIETSHWRIVVRLYLNIEGLCRRLLKSGLVPDTRTFYQFLIGFTQNQQLFDVVDVGHGKEQTDYKIKANFDMFVSNVHCKQLVLGIAHDNGYIPMLNPWKTNERVRRRIILLITEAQTPEYKALPFPYLGFEKMLHSSMSLNTPTHSPKFLGAKKAERQPEKNEQQSPRIASQLSPPQTPAEPTVIVPSRFIYPTPVWINNLDQRIDHRIPEPSREASEAFSERLNKNKDRKPCNDHNLLAGGCTNSRCYFDHTIQLPEKECLVLAKRARNAACRAGTECRNANCVHAHVCLRGISGDGCRFGDGCHLKTFHGIKNEGVQRWSG